MSSGPPRQALDQQVWSIRILVGFFWSHGAVPGIVVIQPELGIDLNIDSVPVFGIRNMWESPAGLDAVTNVEWDIGHLFNLRVFAFGVRHRSPGHGSPPTLELFGLRAGMPISVWASSRFSRDFFLGPFVDQAARAVPFVFIHEHLGSRAIALGDLRLGAHEAGCTLQTGRNLV